MIRLKSNRIKTKLHWYIKDALKSQTSNDIRNNIRNQTEWPINRFIAIYIGNQIKLKTKVK